MFKIDDLKDCESLDKGKLATIRGGFDPFSHAGLTHLLSSIPGYPKTPSTDLPGLPSQEDPCECVHTIPGLGPEGGTVEWTDSNHTELTSRYSACVLAP